MLAGWEPRQRARDFCLSGNGPGSRRLQSHHAAEQLGGRKNSAWRNRKALAEALVGTLRMRRPRPRSSGRTLANRDKQRLALRRSCAARDIASAMSLPYWFAHILPRRGRGCTPAAAAASRSIWRRALV